jgi:HD-like signal output (HDOD) protein
MSQYGKDLDFDGLRLLFRRAGVLPQLPGSAHRLLNAIDSGQASAADLERIITCDAALTANLLRLANSADTGLPGGITTVRSAILRLGQRAVRSVCVSLTVQGLLGMELIGGLFDARRYARHAIATGFLSRYVFARRQQRETFETQWHPDEFFAAGLLHDLGLALLARVAPNTYAMIATSAESKGIAFAQEFADVYGSGLGTLGGDAARAWGLPQVFYAAIEFSEVPSESTEEQTALYCIHYANYLAVKMGARIEPWAYDPQLDALAQSEIGLDEEEIEAVLQVVDGQTTAYISAASAGLAA